MRVKTIKPHYDFDSVFRAEKEEYDTNSTFGKMLVSRSIASEVIVKKEKPEKLTKNKTLSKKKK